MTNPNKYEIREERYTKTFHTETVVLYQGAMLEQMKNLFHTIKRRKTPNTIRIFLCDLEGNVIESIN